MTTTTKPKVTKEKSLKDKYYTGIGRRKTSLARIRLYEQLEKKEVPILVNGKEIEKYFSLTDFIRQAKKPLEITGFLDRARITCIVRGGGLRGQSEAIQLGIARALISMDEGLKPVLKSAKLLTRDARKVERKKPGLKKARKAPQWSKR
ncbi:MAG: 30S ribosomal protein S9 [Candidatus Moranbacteria bacterium]|nr:30S ribosomal protein S9 [Candidatus Moranbacteria bacterium]